MKSLLAGLAAAVLVLAASDVIVLHAFSAAAAHFDQAVRLAVHSVASRPLTEAVKLLTWLGSTWVLAALALSVSWFLWRSGNRRLARFPVTALALSEALTEITKLIVRRYRPAPWFGIPPLETWSFPSGHSLNSTVCCVVAAAVLVRVVRAGALRPWLGIAAIALPLLIGLTRIYLCVHWPTDVLTGWIAGACLAAGLVQAAGEVPPPDK